MCATQGTIPQWRPPDGPCGLLPAPGECDEVLANDPARFNRFRGRHPDFRGFDTPSDPPRKVAGFGFSPGRAGWSNLPAICSFEAWRRTLGFAASRAACVGVVAEELNKPDPQRREPLLSRLRDAFLARGYDAITMIELAQLV